MQKVWRFLPFAYYHPYTNMAIDEVILEAYKAGFVPPTFRVYGWRPAGISIGYFQKAEEILDISACRRKGIPFVRRISAGQMVFHSQDVCYALVCSKDDLCLSNSVKESFKQISRFLINAYRSLGLETDFFLEKETGNKHSPFCFAFSREFDIAFQGRKLGGSAQRRKGDVVFQHGSIPLRLKVEKLAPLLRKGISIESKALGLEEALGRPISFNEFARLITESFKCTFSLRFKTAGLTPREKREVRLAVKRYEKAALVK